MVIDKDHITNMLLSVVDPEIPVMTIKDMGMLRSVDIIGDNIIVYITPTYSGCPAMDMIEVHIKSTLQEEGYDNVEVKTVLSPPWTTDMMTEEAKEKLRKYGIAPPVGKSRGMGELLGTLPNVNCPRCESNNTEVISEFGATACKALYKCNDCLEPFDYFKCH